MDNAASPTPPSPPDVISSRKLRTYKIMLLAALLCLLFSVLFISLLVKGQSQKPGTKTAIRPTLEQPSPTKAARTITEPTLEMSQEPVCNKDECLIDAWGTIGFAKLKGYYQTYNTVDWGDKKVTCEGLLVTGGTDKLINNHKDAIKSGNGLNEMRGNDLIVSISLDDLTSQEKQLIKNSKSANQVELGVIKRYEGGGRGVSSCYATIDIIYVKPTE